MAISLINRFVISPLFILFYIVLISPVDGFVQEDSAKPNFIFFITDDVSWNDLRCYGNDKIETPNLDRMAAEGLRFDNAYLTISSCSPSRCSIITGRYPHNTGAPELHTSLPQSQFTFPQALKAAGYYTVLSGKNHMGKVGRAFDKISGGSGPGKESDWVSILQNRPKDKPFFCWFASTDAHRNWQFSKEVKKYTNDEVEVPPFLFDGPVTRKDLAGYYHEVNRADYYAGKLREELETQGIAKNTYLIFCSDNGRPFPRCKTRLYDSGIKTPLIIWAPEKIKPGVTDSLVSSIDFSATILALAGIDKQPTVQGVSFAEILKDPKASIRDFVFSEHNWHVYQAHERMVKFKNWVYIRNAWPERQNLCVESTYEFPAGKELWDAEKAGKLKEQQRDIFQVPRAAEELYNVTKDPHQFKNLANSPEHETVLKKMRSALDKWSKQTGDTVPDNPTNDREDNDRKKYKNHKRGDFPGSERNANSINAKGPLTEKDLE